MKKQQNLLARSRTISDALLGVCAGTLLLAGAQNARAQSGTWINPVSDSWSNTVSWAAGTVANGAGNTADFGTLDLTAQTTVTLDSARTLGTLIFGDTDTNTPAGWLIANGGVAGNTIAATNITVNPIFAVNSDAATNDAIIAGVVTGSSFVKKGAGTLLLQSANTMASLQVDEGVIAVGNATALGSGNKKVVLNGGGVRVSTSGTIANTNEVLTTGHIYAPPTSFLANYDAYNGPWIGSASATLYLHLTSGRFSPFNGNVNALTNFFGTVDLADSAGGLLRFNLGAGPYNCSAIKFNLGTNNGRIAPRITANPSTFRMGSLAGGPNTRLESSEQGAGLNTTWEIGELNTSMLFEGRMMNYNSTVGRNGHLRKVGTGRLTLTSPSHSYTGSTTVSNGVLALSNTCSIASSPVVNVAAGAILDVSGLVAPFGLAATQVLGGNGGVIGNVSLTAGTIAPGIGGLGTLSFTNNLSLDGALTTTNLFELTGPGTGDLIQVVGDLSFANTVVLRVVPTGASIPDGTYTLIKWGGNLTGDTNNMVIDYPAQLGTFTLQTNLAAKEIRLVVAGVAPAANLVWNGDGVANDWDTATANWLNGVTPSVFFNGDKVTFTDVGSNNVPVNLATTLNPGALVFNATKDYTLASSGAFGVTGSSTLVKSNTGVLTVTADNSFNGGAFIVGGTVQIGDGVASTGSLGAGNVTNNATLVYNRPDNVTNVNFLTGSGQVVKSGANTLTIAGNNTYTGGTVVSNGTLNINTYGTLGTGPVTMAGGTFLVVPTGGATTGVSNAITVVQDSTMQYSGGNSFACVTFGALTGTPGATLTVNSTASSTFNRLRLYGNFTNSLNLNLSVTKVQMAPYNAAGSQQYDGVISGPGLITQRGNGGIVLNNTNTFTGNCIFSQGSIGVGMDSVYDSGTLVGSPLGVGAALLAQETGLGGNGTIYASGGPRVIGNTFAYDNSTNGYTWIIAGTNDLSLTGTFNLAGQIDTTTDVIRPVQVDNTGRTLIAGPISDDGRNFGITKTGAGLLLVNGTNTYTGNTTVSNGTLGGTGILASSLIVVPGASLAPGSSIGTFTVSSNAAIDGNLVVEINKSGPQTNDFVSVDGALSGAPTVVVTNVGPALAAGDSFKLFNKAVTGGGAATITPAPGAGLAWTNNLAADGSIGVVTAVVPPTIPTTPTNLVFSASGGNLTFNWPSNYIGWTLQVQTNTRSVGLVPATNAWFDVVGSTTTNQMVIPVSPAAPTVFYRLFYFAP